MCFYPLSFMRSFSVAVRKVVVLGVTVDKKYSRSDTDRRRRRVREGL